MKITFVYPDFEYRETTTGWLVEKGGWYHEGLAQLGSIAEEANWEADLIHLMEPTTEEKFKAEIKNRKPDVVGFSLRVGASEYSKRLVKWVKEVNPKIIITLGAYFPTMEPEQAISWPEVSIIFIGESEVSMAYFLNKVAAGKSFSDTPSTWVKTTSTKGKTKIIKNPVGPLVEDLDTLPLPKFDIFDFEKLIGAKLKVALAGMTRGCPYNCTYCWNNIARKLYPNKEKYVRFRSPENGIAYMKKLIKTYPGAKRIRFTDDIWPVYTEWSRKLKDLYIKEINLPFECNYRANLFNEDKAKILKEMGCAGIYFGVESGDEYIRNSIFKRMLEEKDMQKAFDLCHKHGIKTYAYNIIGAPYENMKTALATVKLNARLGSDTMFFAIYSPYGGTDLERMAVEAGFFDPSKPLDPDVNIIMPDFNYNQIKFAALYAKFFVRLYQFAFKLPGFLKPFMEKILDKIWLAKWLPYHFLTKLMVWYNASILRLKIFIKKNMTPLYFFLKKFQ
ncbi:radical SAM protein [Candidatus Dojkabacteria bacterium]|nr:radical SAM protein [Candidatus Dojkabacteria bacterium]